MLQLEALKPYQETGAAWLAAKAQAFLGDEMGLGKSAQAIHACDRLGLRRILVLCPASLRINWEREFRKFSPLDRPCHLFYTASTPIPADFEGVAIISYDLLVAPSAEKLKKAVRNAPLGHEQTKATSRYLMAQKLERELLRFVAALKRIPWDVLILDEAHYLKERSADRTKVVYGSRTRPGLLPFSARCWRLSGTPTLNNAGELWTHLKTAGLIAAPYWDFVFHFCTGFNDDWGFRIKGVQHEAELKRLLAPFLLRRLKADVLPELPPVFWQEVVVERSAVSTKFFKPFEVKELEVQGQKLSQALAAISLRPRAADDELAFIEAQAGPMATLRRYVGLAKLPALLDLIKEELEAGKYGKILLFGVHQEVLEQAFSALHRYHPALVYGKTPPAKRQAEVDRFQGDSRCRVFLGNILAAGVGLNLTAACEVGLLESDWVPANNAQAVARAHRMLQTLSVRVRQFSLRDSVDEDVNRALLRKERELSKVFA